MVDVAYGEIADALQKPSRAGPASWRDDLHRVATNFRATAFRHDWFVDLLGGRPHLGPNALLVLEATAAPLAAAPVSGSPQAMWSALGAINAYLIGAIRADIVEDRVVRTSGQTENAWQADVAPYLSRQFATGRFPTLERLAFHTSQPDPLEDFTRGLDTLLDGIAAAHG